MRQIKLGQILENAGRLTGRQVGLLGVPESWKMIAALAIEECIRKIAAEKLPMLQRIEYRHYRPAYESSAEYARGNEVWYKGNYWRLEAEYAGVEPGVDETWRKLDMSEVAAFIAWDQPWENTVIDRGGVDTARFAYTADPKYSPDAKPIANVRMTEFGIVLPAPAPKGVWVRFVPQYQKVSFVEFEAGKAYEAGEAVYVAAEKEVYQAWKDVPAGDTLPVQDPEHWDRVRLPEIFEGWMTRAVAVEFLTEDQGKYQTKAAADREFEELCARYHEGNGETRARTGRFCR